MDGIAGQSIHPYTLVLAFGRPSPQRLRDGRHVDELARAAGKDPLAYRRLLLKDEPRHLRVLDLAADKFGSQTQACPLQPRQA